MACCWLLDTVRQHAALLRATSWAAGRPRQCEASACLGGAAADQAGSVRVRVLLPLRCRYALTGKEVKSILMQRLVKVDGKVSGWERRLPGRLAGLPGVLGTQLCTRMPHQRFWRTGYEAAAAAAAALAVAQR